MTMKKIFLAITLIFSITSNTIAQESKTYYEKITGSGTANGGEYNYKATLEAKIYNSGLGEIAVKFGIKEYKITSFKYKEEFYYKTDEGFPIEINNIQSDLIDGYLNIKSATDHYSVADQKFSMLGIRKGHLDNVELNNENIKSIKNYNNGGKVSFDDFYLEFSGKLKNTYFEELAKIASSYDILKRKEKNDNYLAQQKEKAKEKLKEIEIAQEREKKAREREALKPENYYKTSPNAIKTGGYPITGYKKAQQDIKRVEASYSKIEKLIRDMRDRAASEFRESENNYVSPEERIDEMNKAQSEMERRKNKLRPKGSLYRLLNEINENDDYNDEYHEFSQNYQNIYSGNIFLKVVRSRQFAGPRDIRDYTGSWPNATFKTNQIPKYYIYHSSHITIPIHLVKNHQYLFEKYVQLLKKGSNKLSYEQKADVLAFVDEKKLDIIWNKIYDNYSKFDILRFNQDDTKFPLQSFESYVSENINEERDYLKQIEDKEKIKGDNKKKIDLIIKKSKSYKKIYFKYKPYYLVKNHNNIYGLIDEAGNVLTGNIDPINHLGNGYFEIIKEKIKADVPIISTRRSFIYDLNKRERYPNALFIQDYKQYNYLLLFDSKLQKWGFINIPSLSKPSQGISLVYPKYDKFVSFGGDSEHSPNLFVMNNGLNGVVNNIGYEIVPIKYAAIKEHEVKSEWGGSITHYWCRTVEDYKIAHKFDETGKYLGRWKLHKSWAYIKKLKD